MQADLLREQQERDAERKLWEEKETEFRNQVPALGGGKIGEGFAPA